MATVTSALSQAQSVLGESRFLFRNVGWEGFRALLTIRRGRVPRLSYAHGDVEFMSPHWPHESSATLFDRVVAAVAQGLAIPFRSAASTTLSSEVVDRAAEPDKSYYIGSITRTRGHQEIDLDLIPPPDLVIEVEITNSLLDKLDLYAKLLVPELWRYDGETLTVLILGPDGRYTVSETSASFPFLPMSEVVRFVRDEDSFDEGHWLDMLQAWVRETLLPLHRGQANPE